MCPDAELPSTALCAVRSDRVPPATMLEAVSRVIRLPAALASGALLVLVLGGCQLKHPTDSIVHGKQLFVAKCGSCHVLSHAATAGTIGPNLDQAFAQSRADGFKGTDIRALVKYQIEFPNPQGGMPAMLFTGQKAGDVAAYVAGVAGIPGQDTGALANAVATVAQKPATEKSGILEIDADPSGQLKYLAPSATATAGSVTLRMINKSATPHDIAITGGGVADQIGATVTGGGVSTVKATLKPGTYTFYCSVPGHRAAGMAGTLTVK